MSRWRHYCQQQCGLPLNAVLDSAGQIFSKMMCVLMFRYFRKVFLMCTKFNKYFDCIGCHQCCMHNVQAKISMVVILLQSISVCAYVPWNMNDCIRQSICALKHFKHCMMMRSELLVRIYQTKVAKAFPLLKAAFDIWKPPTLPDNNTINICQQVHQNHFIYIQRLNLQLVQDMHPSAKIRRTTSWVPLSL